MTKFDLFITVALLVLAVYEAVTGYFELTIVWLACIGFYLYFGVYKERQK